MANPKRRHSKARRDKRKSAWLGKLKAPNLSKCPQCGTLKLPHRICPNCGSYKGEIVLVVNKKTKKDKK